MTSEIGIIRLAMESEELRPKILDSVGMTDLKQFVEKVHADTCRNERDLAIIKLYPADGPNIFVVISGDASVTIYHYSEPVTYIFFNSVHEYDVFQKIEGGKFEHHTDYRFSTKHVPDVLRPLIANQMLFGEMPENIQPWERHKTFEMFFTFGDPSNRVIPED